MVLLRWFHCLNSFFEVFVIAMVQDIISRSPFAEANVHLVIRIWADQNFFVSSMLANAAGDIASTRLCLRSTTIDSFSNMACTPRSTIDIGYILAFIVNRRWFLGISQSMNNGAKDGREGRAMYAIECHIMLTTANISEPAVSSTPRTLTFRDSGTTVTISPIPIVSYPLECSHVQFCTINDLRHSF